MFLDLQIWFSQYKKKKKKLDQNHEQFVSTEYSFAVLISCLKKDLGGGKYFNNWKQQYYQGKQHVQLPLGNPD